jgi:hypothetical protein
MQALKRISVNWVLPIDLNAIDSVAISARAAALMGTGTPQIAESINAAAVAAAITAGHAAGHAIDVHTQCLIWPMQHRSH